MNYHGHIILWIRLIFIWSVDMHHRAGYACIISYYQLFNFLSLNFLSQFTERNHFHERTGGKSQR